MIKYPDYDNCIAGIPNSVLKSMGLEPGRRTLELLDRHLEGRSYENVVVILLDGMGKNIMDANLSKDGFLPRILREPSVRHFRRRRLPRRHPYRAAWSRVSMGGLAGTATIRR